MTTTAKHRATERLREEVQRTAQAAHLAIDALDPAAAIAHCRALRSILWRAGNEHRIAVADLLARDHESPEPSTKES